MTPVHVTGVYVERGVQRAHDHLYRKGVRPPPAPTESWWTVPDAEFSAAAARERPRLTGEQLITKGES